QASGALVREEIEDRCRQRNLELIDAQPILPGVKELIVDAKARGLCLAVASSSSQRWVAGHLARLGLLDYFDALVCGDEVERTKPYPDVYLRALEKLDANAGQVVAFEDSLNGMLAARRAGLFCVVIPGTLTQYLTFGEIDLRPTSLAELTLDALEQHLSNRLVERKDAELPNSLVVQLILLPCPAHSFSRNTSFCTLPVEVLGRGPKLTAAGHLKWAMRSRQKAMISTSVVPWPSLSVTKALGRSPQVSSGMAMIAHSSTAGCWAITCS